MFINNKMHVTWVFYGKAQLHVETENKLAKVGH